MEIKRNERGFLTGQFTDRYDKKCSIQKSSLAFEDCIWLGIDDPEPKIMAKDASRLGLLTQEDTGWIDYPLPNEVLVHTRMHLTREQVKDLLPTLTKFVETGEIL